MNAITERSWKWMALLCFAVALIVMAILWMRGLYNTKLPDLLPQIMPQGSVVESARAALLRVQRDSSLVTARAFVQVVVRKRDEQWYGNAEVIRIVPTTIHYAVDLGDIDYTELEYDSQAQVLYVPLPDVKVQSIEPDMSKAEIIRNLDMLRTESITGNKLEEDTEKMVRPAVEEMAKSPEIVRTAKEQAILTVRQFLESALGVTGKQVRVLPYFKSEGKPSSVEKN
jgi:Protein of unknown function (DUF4230)